jgi:hypothetical protein
MVKQGFYVMIFYILGFVFLSGLAAIGFYAGITVARVVRDQFDELMPQRMVDFSGFVETGIPQD